MRQIIAILIVAFAAGVAQAQPLQVRSGDHPTFSRLTIPVPESQPWDAVQTETGVELTLPGFSGGFATGNVFVRMRQDRVASISATDTKLSMAVVCDCVATAFRSGSLLVIDIADRGTPLTAAPLSGPASRSASGAAALPLQRPGSAGQIVLPWIGGNSPFALQSADIADAGTPQQERDRQEAALQADRTALLQEIQQDLVREVANAASRGLLEESYVAPEAVTTAQPEGPPVRDVSPEALPQLVEGPSRNMRITNSMDMPAWAESRDPGATTSGLTCPAEDLLAVETWGSEAGFSAQIGPARTALMNSRDQLDKPAAERLAKLYVYFGFGAEALDVLRLDPSLQAEHPALAAVASILEFGAAGRENVLGGFTDCASDVALWGSLSVEELPSDILIDTNAALRALNKLPKHLRQVVAPELSDRFVQYGDSEAAAAALRSVERLPGPPTPQAVMAQAQLTMETGGRAETYLEEIIDSNSPQSPEALVKLVEGKLANDEPLSYEIATLVEAYVQELRGTELGRKLQQTQVIALSQSQHFAEAFAALEAIEPSLSPRNASDLRQAILEQLAKRGSNSDFLEHVFEQDAAALEDLASASKLQLAARMLDLGFASQAQSILATVPDAPRDPARQLVAARTALMLEQPFQAQAALIGLEGAEAALLLAQSKEMAGDYRAAAEIFASNDAGAQAMQAAWLAADWRDLIAADAPTLGAVAALGQPLPEAEEADLGPLGRADRALAESSAARGALEQLLGDPMMQVTPDS